MQLPPPNNIRFPINRKDYPRFNEEIDPYFEEIAKNSVASYRSGLIKVAKHFRFKTIGELVQGQNPDKAIAFLETVKNINTRSANINAFVSSLGKHLKLISKEEFERLNKKNKDLGHEKNDIMLQNARVLPIEINDFNRGVQSFLAKYERMSSQSFDKLGYDELLNLMIIILWYEIPQRPHVFEECRVCHTNAEFEKVKKQKEKRTAFFLPDLLLFVPEQISKNRKQYAANYSNKGYGDLLRKTIDAYLQTKQMANTTTLYKIKVKAIEARIKKAFAEATDNTKITAQILRRIKATKDGLNARSLTTAEKRKLAEEMGHSFLVHDAYRVINDNSSDAEKELDDMWMTIQANLRAAAAGDSAELIQKMIYGLEKLAEPLGLLDV